MSVPDAGWPALRELRGDLPSLQRFEPQMPALDYAKHQEARKVTATSRSS